MMIGMENMVVRIMRTVIDYGEREFMYKKLNNGYCFVSFMYVRDLYVMADMEYM